MPDSLNKLSQSFLREVGGWVGKHPYRVLSLRIVKGSTACVASTLRIWFHCSDDAPPPDVI
jgi:hypothetical protein